MKSPVYGMLAAFTGEASFQSALRKLREAGYVRIDAYTPYPLEAGMLPEAPTPIGWIMFFAGVFGAAGGFYLQWFAARDYPVDVGGRPLNSWPAFIPITFEVTVLSAALVGILSLFWLTGLPRLHHPVFADPRFKRASQDRFFICVRFDDPLYAGDGARRILSDSNAESIAEVPA